MFMHQESKYYDIILLQRIPAAAFTNKIDIPYDHIVSIVLYSGKYCEVNPVVKIVGPYSPFFVTALYNIFVVVKCLGVRCLADGGWCFFFIAQISTKKYRNKCEIISSMCYHAYIRFYGKWRQQHVNEVGRKPGIVQTPAVVTGETQRSLRLRVLMSVRQNFSSSS